MARRHVLLQLRHSSKLAKTEHESRMAMAEGREAKLSEAAVPKLAKLALDTSFPAVQLPGSTPHEDEPGKASFATFDLDFDPAHSTYLVRGSVDEKDLDALLEECRTSKEVEGVFADVEIAPFAVCPAGPVGSDQDVEQLLCTTKLRAAGMDGNGVLVAIVDTGISMSHLASKGKTPSFDLSRSWKPPGSTGTPGSYAPDHGTMCAFDVCIAAPKCTLLDIALLRSTTPGPTVMSGFLSDAVLAFKHLLDLLRADPDRTPSLVVNNSWGMYKPSWDFPVGHPGNYSDNPSHPFNLIVASLERAGADILFAAGNCGPECPSTKCGGYLTKPIYGANGHDKVLCVAGATVQKVRIGYSSMGPGRLAHKKPDITGYTHFKGSGVYTADNGTSAACPVVAGVVAAARSLRPYLPSDPSTHPAAMRELVRTTAQDIGTTGFDFGTGYGLVNACAMREKLVPSIVPPPPPVVPTSICDIFPQLCKPVPPIPWWCKRWPWLCGASEPGVPLPTWPPIPPLPPIPGPGPSPFAGDDLAPSQPQGQRSFSAEEVALILSIVLGASQGAGRSGGKSGGCGCS